MPKKRLDSIISELGLADSLKKARALIMSGVIYVNGQKSDKPGTMFSASENIERRDIAEKYVSRGGFKLEKALDVFNADPSGLVCIDCGASTGGFTDVLLKRGAKKVYAVDVGYGQLAWSLRQDDRVVVMERTNVRYLTEESFPEKPDFAVFDLSFISLQLVIPPVEKLLAEGAPLICLIKPQFEAERADVGEKGVVRSEKIHEKVLFEFKNFAINSGLSLLDITHSPIKGPQGNIEYLAYLKKAPNLQSFIDIPAVVAGSHEELGK